MIKRTWCVKRRIGIRWSRRWCVKICKKGWIWITNWFAIKKANIQERIRAKRRKKAQKNVLGDNRVLLSPMILSSKSWNRIDQYRYNLVNELRNAIDSNNCNNIAITGVYGSGKSSIIQTYLAEMSSCFRAKKVLTLSLSNFMDKEIKDEDTAYERTIENKIFQHILFKANEEKTAQSHYKKIANISRKRAFGMTMLLVWVVVCFLIVFFPQRILSFKYISDLYEWVHSLGIYRWIHGIVYIGAIASMIYALIRCVIYTIRRIRKIRIKGVEVEKLKVNFEENTKTPFNDLLDEILYFFRAGGYKIVIFEDLDRIANPKQLFLKLREINLLLNDSDYYKRNNEHIKFIYAIRDDLFESDIRTKCFDYIIPVVPVVDKYNAGDYLIKHYGKTIMQSIGTRNLNVLGLFIRDKRELNNIVNEYTMSHEAFIDDTTSPKKLLALLVYKNAYPKDYAAAYRKEGCLYAIFDSENKKEFYEQVIDDILRIDEDREKEILRLVGIIATYRGDILNVLKKGRITRMRCKGEDYPIDEFITNDSLYIAFVNNKIESYKDADNVRHPYKYEYTQLAEEAHPEEDVLTILNENAAKIAKLEQDRNELQLKIEKKKTARISALIKDQDSKKVLEIIKKICAESYKKEDLDAEQLEQHAKLMLTFLREDFIAEDYATYMSLTYEGTLTDNDFKFVHAVLQDIALKYHQPIDNCNAVIQHLNSDDYQKRSILNDTLLDYLLPMKDNVNLRDVIEVARKDFEFLLHYEAKSKHRGKFILKLFDHWKGVVSEIATISDGAKTRDGMLKLYLEWAPKDVALEDSEKEYLEGRYDFVCQNIAAFNIIKLEQFVQHHKLRFDKLLPPDENTRALFDYVTENCCFAIHVENLRILYGEEFDNASYTQIYKGKKEIFEYIFPKFNALLDKMPEMSIHEESETIVRLLNEAEMNFEKLLAYLDKQEAQIDLKDVKDDECIVELLQMKNLVRPTWNNVGNAYSRVSLEENKIVAQFVKNNVDTLTQTECTCGNADKVEDMLLLVADVFTNEEYERVADCFTKKMGQPELEGMEVPDEHMRILIRKGLLLFDKDTYECIETNYSTQVFAAYVIANFAAFMKDDEITVNESNELGIEILNSELSLDEKRQYMEVLPFDKDERKAEEYAKLYCLIYEQIGDFSGADKDALVDAMNMYHEDGSWFAKISIVNKYNRTRSYDKEFEKKLLDSLGGGYIKLSQLKGKETYDDNEQNRELLSFLEKKDYPYISTVFPPSDGHIKVTFRTILKELLI